MKTGWINIWARYARHFTLRELDLHAGGLARNRSENRIYYPLTHNFCESCNRVRLACTGQLYIALVKKTWLVYALHRAAAIRSAISTKPKCHDFDYKRREIMGQVLRHMSHTGG